MSSAQRTLTVALWFLVVISLIGVLAMQRWADRREAANAAARAAFVEINPDQPTTLPADDREPLNLPAPTFAFTDHTGATFDVSALKGKIWTFSLFFSECQGVCPTMRSKFEAVQSVASDPDVHFVLLSVDPAKDNPEVLAKYAKAAKVDMSRTHLLTGDLAETQRVAREFLIPFDLAVNHSSKVMLVDREGVIRSFYSGTDEVEMKRLSDDIGKLLNESK